MREVVAWKELIEVILRRNGGKNQAGLSTRCDNCGTMGAALRVTDLAAGETLYYCDTTCRLKKWCGAENWPVRNVIVGNGRK
jgi:hypothetical protein